MWWFTEFNSVVLPLGNFVANLDLAFAQNRTRTTGGEGEYDLDGDRTPMLQQSYSCEFTLPQCDYDAKYNALKGAMRRRGLLKRSNYSTVQRATAKVTSITDTTTPNDIFARTKRMTVTFTAEPYWYDDAESGVVFTLAMSIRPENLGNARAVKFVVLTISSATGTSLEINTHGDGDGTPYDEGYYDTFYYDGSDVGNEDGSIEFASPTGSTIIIDAGNSRVTIGGVDSYDEITIPDTQMALLWLEPGVNEITFNQPVTGTLVWRNAWL